MDVKLNRFPSLDWICGERQSWTCSPNQIAVLSPMMWRTCLPFLSKTTNYKRQSKCYSKRTVKYKEAMIKGNKMEHNLNQITFHLVQNQVLSTKWKFLKKYSLYSSKSLLNFCRHFPFIISLGTTLPTPSMSERKKQNNTHKYDFLLLAKSSKFDKNNSIASNRENRNWRTCLYLSAAELLLCYDRVRPTCARHSSRWAGSGQVKDGALF
jgi:hypothetical protein